MRKPPAFFLLTVLAVLGIAGGCSKSSDSGNASDSASPASSSAADAAATPATDESAAPSATSEAASSPSAATQTVAYSDLSTTFGHQQIEDLAKLGVFGTPAGAFNPAGTITRGDFTHWLVNANNAIWANEPDRIIRPSQNTTSAYPDVSTSHPDFPYIQGLYDAGFAAGFPDKTFKPDQPLTHEQMIAIKESVDRGGLDAYYVNFWAATTPNWKDKAQINKIFRGAIAEDSGLDRSVVASWSLPTYVIGNVGRAFGAIAMFHPQQPVTRAEAALVLWKMGAHTDHHGAHDAPRSAADALQPATPAPSSSP